MSPHYLMRILLIRLIRRIFNMYVIVKPGNDIYHHGVKGQKWGIRRYEERRNKIYSKLTNGEKKI